VVWVMSQKLSTCVPLDVLRSRPGLHPPHSRSRHGEGEEVGICLGKGVRRE